MMMMMMMTALGCFVWGKLCWHQWWASYGLRTALSLLPPFAIHTHDGKVHDTTTTTAHTHTRMRVCVCVCVVLFWWCYVFRPSISDDSFGRKTYNSQQQQRSSYNVLLALWPTALCADGAFEACLKGSQRTHMLFIFFCKGKKK